MLGERALLSLVEIRNRERLFDVLDSERKTVVRLRLQQPALGRRRLRPRVHVTAVRGYDKRMGARPMARIIQEHIKRPLAEELLFGKLAGGGHVRVEVAPDGESLQLTVEPTVRELEHLPESAGSARAARRPRNGERRENDLAEQKDEGSGS